MAVSFWLLIALSIDFCLRSIASRRSERCDGVRSTFFVSCAMWFPWLCRFVIEPT